MADDIVTRLRTVDEFSDAIGIMDAAADEIERLRAAGNALHAWITVNATSIQQERASHDAVLTAWEEARRG